MAQPYRKQKEQTLSVHDSAMLLPFLLEKLPHQSRNAIKSFLAHRQIAVNGRTTTEFDAILNAGDVVTVRTIGAKAPNPNHLVQIIFEDDEVLVVDKKIGTLSQPNRVRSKEKTALCAMNEHVQRHDKDARVFLVFSLDRELSGLMLFAKSEESFMRLKNDLEKGAIVQKYVAVVEGTPEKESEQLVHLLKPHGQSHKLAVTLKEDIGKKAITEYKMLKSNEHFSLLEVRQLTNMNGQIRCQLAAVGMPIAGDKKYKAKQNPLGRVCLHAQILSFYHPFTGKPMIFDTGIPSSFR